IRAGRFDRGDRLLAVRAFADNLDICLFFEERHDARSRDGFVIDDQRPDFCHAAPTRIDSTRARSTVNGMVTVTRKPGLAFAKMRRWSFGYRCSRRARVFASPTPWLRSVRRCGG